MGEVFEGEHVLVGRRAAVKILLPELSSFEDVSGRFFNEARAVASIRHEGIVQLFDFGLHEGSAFLVMEMLDGETLAERVRRRGRLPVGEAVAIARQVASAMAAAHAAGVVHRDLKPENIVLVRAEPNGGTRAKVLDFGIAKLANGSLTGVSATRTGQILGTPAFMAPEQCHGASHVDDRADIYALGCVIYFMLTGRPPFVSDGVGATIAAHLYLRPVKPSTYVDGIPANLEALILRFLAKSPEERPSSMGKVDELLAAIAAETGAGTEEDDCEISIVRDDVSVDEHEHAGEHAEIAFGSMGPAGESVAAPPPKRSTRLRLGMAAAAVLGVAMVAPSTWRSRAASAEPTAWETMRPVAPSFAGADVATTVAAEPTPAILADEGAGTITVRVVSRPAGAEVLRASDGRRLGVTPLNLVLPRGAESARLRVRRPGFVPESIDLPADRDGQVAVVLTPRMRLQAASALARRPKLHTPVKDGALDPYGY
jgi:tRNA A-37 threonylcarbamoyl transferase component Bud32